MSTREHSPAVTLARLAVLTLIAGCIDQSVDVPVDPVRRVTPSALVSSDGVVSIFDRPVSCADFANAAEDPVPAGVRLRVNVYPERWEIGPGLDASGRLSFFPEAYDGAGKREDLTTYTWRVYFDRPSDYPTFELLSAPTARGSRARARLDARIAFERELSDVTSDACLRVGPSATFRNGRWYCDEVVRVDEISTEFDIEVCGDITP